MKKLISMFSDKLLSNQQLKTVKGGNYYCTCGNGGAPFSTANAGECSTACWGNSSPPDPTIYYNCMQQWDPGICN